VEKNGPGSEQDGPETVQCELWLLIEGVRRLRARVTAERFKEAKHKPADEQAQHNNHNSGGHAGHDFLASLFLTG
jgi:hypothetical protein